jgi:hypothetical protein
LSTNALSTNQSDSVAYFISHVGQVTLSGVPAQDVINVALPSIPWGAEPHLVFNQTGQSPSSVIAAVIDNTVFVRTYHYYGYVDGTGFRVNVKGPFLRMTPLNTQDTSVSEIPPLAVDLRSGGIWIGTLVIMNPCLKTVQPASGTVTFEAYLHPHTEMDLSNVFLARIDQASRGCTISLEGNVYAQALLTANSSEIAGALPMSDKQTVEAEVLRYVQYMSNDDTEHAAVAKNE